MHVLSLTVHYLQAYAPGAPVIVIGTHLDQVNSQRAHYLVTLVKDTYTNKKGYPLIADVCCIRATGATALVAGTHVGNVRKKIYDVANHLYLVNNKGKISLLHTMCNSSVTTM